MKYLLIMVLMLSIFLFTNCSSEKEIKTIRIGMCSDVHLPTMHDSEKRITSFIDSMKIANPDFIIELGDFGIPKKGYAPYFDIWNSFICNLLFHILVEIN